MESLFDNLDFTNQKPLRKYEPLIRFNVKGEPQPRRLIDKLKINEVTDPVKTEPNKSDDLMKKSFSAKSNSDTNTTSTPLATSSKPNTMKSHQPTEDLKRKTPHAPEKGMEPMKKKQPTQQRSITSFFGKKT